MFLDSHTSTPVQESVESPGPSQGEHRGTCRLATTSHCATGKRVAQVGKGAQSLSLCQAVKGRGLMAGISRLEAAVPV